MSDTPRTDAIVAPLIEDIKARYRHISYDDLEAVASIARTLERDLTAANARAETAEKQRDELRALLKAHRELLADRVYHTSQAQGAPHTRKGYTLETGGGSAYRDIDYRNFPLYPTSEAAIDAAIIKHYPDLAKALAGWAEGGGK